MFLTYSLTINKNQKTDKIYHPKYKIPEQYHRPEKQQFDTTDHGFRKFRNYSEFTRKYDKVVLP